MSKLLKALITLTILSFSSGSAVAESLIHRPLVDAKARFELTQASGKLLRFEDLKGQLSLVYFGYTTCLMQCPPTWISFERVHTLLGADADKVQLLFISIDPERDSVERLADWQKNWPHITGLTGSADQIDDAARTFGIFYARRPMHAMPSAMPRMMQVKRQFGGDKRINWNAKRGDNYYMMDHTTHAFLIDAENNYVTHFELEESPDLISSYIKKYLNR